MDKKIKELVERSKEDFVRDTQRYELLSRNSTFVKELKETKKKLGGDIFFKVRDINPMEIMSDLSEKNILLVNDYPKHPPVKTVGGVYVKNLGPGVDINKKLKIFTDDYIPRWVTFCERWHILAEWDGKLNSLRGNLKGSVELEIVEDKKKGVSAIIIKIDNWTILNDIREIWNEIEKYQNKLWKKEEKRTNFARDLSWHDLYKVVGLKLSDIAKIWINSFPDDIDLLVIRRIKKEIEKEDFKDRNLSDTELLHEVKSGSLKKYKDYFEGERDFYITGISATTKSPKGKFNIPFVDVVKKAISRMETQISQMYYPYDRSRFIEAIVKSLSAREFSLKL